MKSYEQHLREACPALYNLRNLHEQEMGTAPGATAPGTMSPPPNSAENDATVPSAPGEEGGEVSPQANEFLQSMHQSLDQMESQWEEFKNAGSGQVDQEMKEKLKDFYNKVRSHILDWGQLEPSDLQGNMSQN